MTQLTRTWRIRDAIALASSVVGIFTFLTGIQSLPSLLGHGAPPVSAGAASTTGRLFWPTVFISQACCLGLFYCVCRVLARRLDADTPVMTLLLAIAWFGVAWSFAEVFWPVPWIDEAGRSLAEQWTAPIYFLVATGVLGLLVSMAATDDA